jgi:hypothetical protein
MNESTWPTCPEPTLMLEFLGDRLSDRKLRLLACGCFRRLFSVWKMASDSRVAGAIDLAVRYAEGMTNRAEQRAVIEELRPEIHAFQPGDPRGSLRKVAINLLYGFRVATRGTIDVCRDIAYQWVASGGCKGPAGEPSAMVGMKVRHWEAHHQAALLRDVVGNPFAPSEIAPAWLTWNDGVVRKLAQAIYDEDAFDRLPILADALEDAGCTDDAVLRHCREPGAHNRGCWVVDELLGKS